MPHNKRVPSLKEHYHDNQGETPLPIWRPEVYFKYPPGEELSEAEILRLLDSSDRVSSAKEQSKVLSSAPRRTSMISSEIPTSLPFSP